MKQLRLIVAIGWLLAAFGFVALGVTSSIDASRENPVDRTVIEPIAAVVAYAVLAFLGAVFTIQARVSGKRLLQAASALALSYGVIYLVLGGLDDAPGYGPFVTALSLLSFVTFAAFRGALSVGP